MTPQLLAAASGSFAAGSFFPPHRHTSWEMMYYRDGRTEFTLDGELIECRPGTILMTRPGSVQSERAITRALMYVVAIDAPPDHGWPTISYDDSNQTVDRLCRCLVDEWAGLAPRRDEMITSALWQLDIFLTRAATASTPDERLIAEAKRLIENGIPTHVRLADVARDLAVCPAVLRSRFQRVCGCTPMEYVKSVRAKSALALLRRSDMTLDAIASMCGYHSASHLSRDIRSVTGLSPGAVRSSAG